MRLKPYIYTSAENFFRNMSIGKKLNIFYGLMIFCIIVVLAIIANLVSYNAIAARTINYSQQNLGLIDRELDGFVNYMEDAGENIVTNEYVQSFLNEGPNIEHSRQYVEKQNIVTILDNMIEPREKISSIIIYGYNDQIIASSGVNTSQLIESPNRKNEIIKDDIYYYLDTHEINYEKANKNSNCITIIHSINDAKTGRRIGHVEINANETKISQIYSSIKYGESGEYFIINGEGLIISSVDKKALYRNISNTNYYKLITGKDENGSLTKLNGEDYLVTSSRYEKTGWITVSIVPFKELLSDNRLVTIITIITGFILVLLGLLFSELISSSITKPIHKLSQLMSKAGQGDLSVQSNIQRNDEIGLLASSFNKMIQQITGLIDKVYWEQQQKKEFELIALQAQINPHFLYNTLNCISSLAKLGKPNDVVTTINALAKFYDIVLSKGRNIIRVSEEIENVDSYLKIQKMRYGSKFDYAIDVDEEILNSGIVKLSIQPLIENSINHGIRKSRKNGIIRISGKRENQNIIISVIDNGVGFDTAEVDQVILHSNFVNAKTSFGLRSVDERIKLYFGNEYGLEISSKPLVETIVTIILPFGR